MVARPVPRPVPRIGRQTAAACAPRSSDSTMCNGGPKVGRGAVSGTEKERDVESSYHFVIADDHPLFRGALREAVSGLFADATIAEAGSFDDAAALLDKGGDVDLVLLDLAMPGVRGFSGLMYLRAQYPSVPVVVVSANDDPAVIRRCMGFGASGFIPKTLGIESIRAAIGHVLDGGVWTPPDVDLADHDAEAVKLVQ